VPAAGNEKLDFFLYDLHGREMMHRREVDARGFVLHRNGLSDGIYFFTLESASGKRWNGKMIVD
jgi:hypothetical protein